MNFRYDHCQKTDPNFEFQRKLARAGFKLEDREVEHTGKHFCRFIYITQGTPRGRQYLEFIHVGEGGTPNPNTGISFSSTRPLEPISKSLSKKKICLSFEHRNYNWKENSIDRLPGWNFVEFPKMNSKLNFFLVEYEKRKESTDPVEHPNGVFEMVAIEATLSKSDLEIFAKILGKPMKDKFMLSCKTELLFKPGRESRIQTVIVRCRDLKHVAKNFEWDEMTTFQNRPALLVRDPDPKSWNLTIV